MKNTKLAASLLIGLTLISSVLATPANASRQSDMLTMIAYQNIAAQQQAQAQATALANAQAAQQTQEANLALQQQQYQLQLAANQQQAQQLASQQCQSFPWQAHRAVESFRQHRRFF